MAQNDYADGFGVIEEDGLKVRTVSDTRRAALVNWLVTERAFMVTKAATDAQIEDLWQAYKGTAMVMPVRVFVQ